VQIVAILLGLSLLWGYIALAVYLLRKLWAWSVGRPDGVRVLLYTSVLAVFFTPAVVGVGHGAGVAPAWFALLSSSSNPHVVRGALIALAGTWATLFVLGVIARRIRKHPEK
jgi:hypothetical protein